MLKEGEATEAGAEGVGVVVQLQQVLQQRSKKDTSLFVFSKNLTPAAPHIKQ